MSNVKNSSVWNAKAVAAVLCLALAVVPLVACSGQQGADSASSSAAASQAASGQAAGIDTSSWKTLGDALAVQTDSMASGWDSEYYVTVFKAGVSIVRVVAKLDPATSAKVDAVDWSKNNVGEQVEAAAGAAPIESAEDLTGELVSQEELDKLVGKTGQELYDEGWKFDNYYMFTPDQTGATFAKGYLSYAFTFDTAVPEDNTDMNGDLLKDAKLVEAEFEGASSAATDTPQADQN